MRLPTYLRALALMLCSVLFIAPQIATPTPVAAQTVIKKGNPNARSIPVLLVDPTSSTSAGKTGLTGAAVGTAVTITQSTSSGSTASGATSLVLVSASGFPSSGSVWVPSQNGLITYTGVGSNTLTGIPASGAGSITATIPTSSIVTTGIAGSITVKYTINAGSGQGYPALAAGSIIETANGVYEYIPPTLVESATTNDVHYIFSASGAIDYVGTAVFQSYKVDDLGAALVPTMGACLSGSTTTVINSNLTASTANCYKGQMLVFTSGADVAQAAIVQSNTSGASSALTVLTAYSSAPSTADAFSLTVGVGGKVVDLLTGTLGVTVTTNNDKTAYSLSQAFPANFSSLGIGGTGHITNVDTLTTYTGNTPQTGDAFARIGLNGQGLTAAPDTPGTTALLTRLPSALTITGGAVTVGTNNDKTGYSLTVAPPTLAQIVAAIPTDTSVQADVIAALTAQGYTVTRAGKLDNLSGDAFARIGAAGAGLTSIGPVTVGGYSAGQDPAALVLDVTAAGHNTANTIGQKINAAGTAGDPLTAAVPGAYGAGTAGYVLGTYLNAAITSRMATFGLPTNFSLLSIDSSGRTVLTPAEHALIPADIFAGSFLTLAGTATISGTGETLTYKQWMALMDAMQGGDNVSTTPTAGATFTVTYYLRGAAHVSGNVVYVATVTLDGSKNQTGRTGKVAQPFPAVN